jgi:hypothetical protein
MSLKDEQGWKIHRAVEDAAHLKNSGGKTKDAMQMLALLGTSEQSFILLNKIK